MSTIIQPLKQDGRPLYVQISDMLSELIQSNAYTPGEKLPSEEELAGLLGVSRPTLRVSIGYLESQGLLVRRHGVGTFISNSQGNHIMGEGLEVVESVCDLADRLGMACERVFWDIEHIPASERLADLPKLDPGKPIVRARYAFKLSGKLFAFFDSNILKEYVDIEALKAYPEKGLLDYINECCRHKFSSTQTKIFAISTGEAIMRWVGLPVGTPLLHMEEMFILDDGQPFVHTLKYFDTSVMHFYMSRRFV